MMTFSVYQTPQHDGHIISQVIDPLQAQKLSPAYGAVAELFLV
jgi:hypothetical protein